MITKNKTFEQSFKAWEKLPSELTLTRGECNQLHNILTMVDLPDGTDIERILNKLEREI